MFDDLRAEDYSAEVDIFIYRVEKYRSRFSVQKALKRIAADLRVRVPDYRRILAFDYYTGCNGDGFSEEYVRVIAMRDGVARCVNCVDAADDGEPGGSECSVLSCRTAGKISNFDKFRQY